MHEGPRIFHYTNAETLALILKNRTIRFTRLDLVDDVDEAQTIAGIPFGQYTFVSCWTQDPIESIPQWHIYSGGMQGVRLSLPAYPFRELIYSIPPASRGIKIPEPVTAPLTFLESVGENYFVAPLFFEHHFSAPVEYVPDVHSRYIQHVREHSAQDGTRAVTVYESAALTRFKSMAWAFQQEHRFCLTILPTRLPIDESATAQEPSRDDLRNVPAAVLAGVDHKLQYFDVPLSNEAIASLAVRTGPLCSAGTVTTIEAILEAWAPSVVLETSALANKIRSRSRSAT